MHDAFLKSVFSDRRMIEILIRGHVREWAGELDFSTLREESTELISKKTLQRRHPDMIWSAHTLGGRRVIFLMEFQRTMERLMALRTTTYTALTLEGIAASRGIRAGDRLPEFVYLVLYHGEGPWSAPARVADLFERSDPGQYRLVSWGDGQSRDDLAALVLGLARSLSAEDMAAQLSALRFAVEERGEADLDAFMVEMVDTMLTLRKYPEGLKQLGAKTMAEIGRQVSAQSGRVGPEGAAAGNPTGSPAGPGIGSASTGRPQVR